MKCLRQTPESAQALKVHFGRQTDRSPSPGLCPTQPQGLWRPAHFSVPTQFRLTGSAQPEGCVSHIPQRRFHNHTLTPQGPGLLTDAQLHMHVPPEVGQVQVFKDRTCRKGSCAELPWTGHRSAMQKLFLEAWPGWPSRRAARRITSR
ncbi:hypothetical protein AAFF_G00347510 [Aldrovandia affinis]|uniref:Uncharacterized protein n=1 Tax=Aldrovandia affinis TaxID=143900 RepID=A0AAD7SJX1_9TELE|nr:hypothetical protein AAFF_G00347510 [Aldrovandia affinis]